MCYEKRKEVSAPIVVEVQKLLAKMMELAGVSLLRAWRKVLVAQAGAEGYAIFKKWLAREQVGEAKPRCVAAKPMLPPGGHPVTGSRRVSREGGGGLSHMGYV